jgi:hypothetical protein
MRSPPARAITDLISNPHQRVLLIQTPNSFGGWRGTMCPVLFVIAHQPTLRESQAHDADLWSLVFYSRIKYHVVAQ